MYYTLSIEDETGKIEITDADVIQGVDVVVYQDDNMANDRSDKLFVDVTVYGVLNNKSNKQAAELFNWSKDTQYKTNYKTVKIKVYESDKKDSQIRDYFFKMMFCSSYQESFLEKGIQAKDVISEGRTMFFLKMKQRKGEIETIVVE